MLTRVQQCVADSWYREKEQLVSLLADRLSVDRDRVVALIDEWEGGSIVPATASPSTFITPPISSTESHNCQHVSSKGPCKNKAKLQVEGKWYCGSMGKDGKATKHYGLHLQLSGTTPQQPSPTTKPGKTPPLSKTLPKKAKGETLVSNAQASAERSKSLIAKVLAKTEDDRQALRTRLSQEEDAVLTAHDDGVELLYKPDEDGDKEQEELEDTLETL